MKNVGIEIIMIEIIMPDLNSFLEFCWMWTSINVSKNCRKNKKFSPISSSKFLLRRIFVSTFFILAVLKLELLVWLCIKVLPLFYAQKHYSISKGSNGIYTWILYYSRYRTLHVDARTVSVGIFYSRRKYGSRWLCSSSLNSISLGNR